MRRRWSAAWRRCARSPTRSRSGATRPASCVPGWTWTPGRRSAPPRGVLPSHRHVRHRPGRGLGRARPRVRRPPRRGRLDHADHPPGEHEPDRGRDRREDRREPRRVIEPLLAALERHPAVRSANLSGSRARGEPATALSDWDVEVATDDFGAVARDLPDLAAVLGPLAQQWDPSRKPATCSCFRAPSRSTSSSRMSRTTSEQPWEARPDTIESIDRHLWDWILWLASKLLCGETERVRHEDRLMWKNLLQPLGVARIPDSIEGAVAAYLEARDGAGAPLRRRGPERARGRSAGRAPASRLRRLERLAGDIRRAWSCTRPNGARTRTRCGSG